MIRKVIPETALVRYGAIPEIARFECRQSPMPRGQEVVVRTRRGLEIGVILHMIESEQADADDDVPEVVRPVSEEDRLSAERIREECRQEFAAWTDRIREWELDLQLVDVERTLDREKLILYVLNRRGSDCTRLALFAAAGGFGLVEVQPVDADGIIDKPDTGSGCGSGGCGCSH